MIVKKEQIQTVRFANGTICTGSDKEGTYKDLSQTPGNGANAEALLTGILTIPGNREKGTKAHWKLILKSSAGTFGAKLNMSTNQAQEVFNSLASVEDFSQPLKFNVWQGTPYNARSKAPTVVHLLKSWEDRKSYYRWKFPFLKDGDQPNPNTAYMPRAKQKVDGNGELMFNDDGYAIRDWKPVNRFIEEKIVNMIRAKLEGLEPDIMNDSGNEPDFMEEQGKTEFPNYQENAKKIKKAFTGTNQAPDPTPPAEEDDLPF